MNDLSARIRTAAAAVAFVGGLSSAAHADDIVIYTAPHFTGESMRLLGETPDTTPFSFHDQAASLEINGRWEVCTEPNYRGNCVVLGSGRHATLGAPIHRRIGSLRPLGARIAEEQMQRREERVARDESRGSAIAAERARREAIAAEESRRAAIAAERARREAIAAEESRRAAIAAEDARRSAIAAEEARR